MEMIQEYGVEFKFVDGVTKKLDEFNRKMAKASKLGMSGVGGGLGARGGGASDPMAKAAKAEQRRIEALDTMRSRLKTHQLLLRKNLTKQEELTAASIKDAMANAKTAKQMRMQVQASMDRLRANKANEKSMKKQNFLLQRMNNSSKQFAGNMISAFALAAGATGITRVGQDFEAVRNTMLAVSATAEESGENFKFARDEAFRLGLGLKESAKGFAKLVAARGEMSLEDTKRSFTGIAEMSTLLGLSAAESTRALNALQQMASKGVVSAKTLAL